MSEFHVQVVRLGEIVKHPNADRLSITRIDDYLVTLQPGTFDPGDLAVYVPIEQARDAQGSSGASGTLRDAGGGNDVYSQS